YGPTEATVAATTWELLSDSEREWRKVPIGRPLSCCQTYVLDQNLQPVPAGVPGELWIGGSTLARGYLKQPELTATKFTYHQFGDRPAVRLFRTGDRARWLH